VGRHSHPGEDSEVIDIAELPQQVIDEVAKALPFTPMFKGLDHQTDELPQVEDEAEESPDTSHCEHHDQLLKQRKRFVTALWAIFILALVLGGLFLAIELTHYAQGGCPAPRPGYSPHR